MVDKVATWVDMERCHGHAVLKRHIAWKWEMLLEEELQKLQHEMDQLDDKDSYTCRSLQRSHSKAQKQLETMRKGDKARAKRADVIVGWIGAKYWMPNLVTQITEIEQQTRAELTWWHHDFIMHKLAKRDASELQDMFAKPEEAVQHMNSCVLAFSDQVPLWAKRQTMRQVFAKHETRQGAKPTHEVRKQLADELSKEAMQKGLQPAIADDNEHEEGIVPAGEAATESSWRMSMPLPDGSTGKMHPTTMREANTDKFRVTFEAHQYVTGWFDPNAEPQGHVARGILVVAGQHARLSNIGPDDRWLHDETIEYAGRIRKHIAGEKCGRALEGWRKIRASHPHLFRHFTVMSQPSCNMDSICMAWNIQDSAHEMPVSLYQRDAYGAAFSDSTTKMRYLSHQAQSTIQAKMTSAMQLTDTDFSHQFKAAVKSHIDEKVEAMQRDSTELPKISNLDIAFAVDAAMQQMVEANEEKAWVLAGLRRNGFLAVRPDATGKMRWCGEEDWAKDKPLGSKRISKTWLDNRLAHVLDEGCRINEPNWERIDGAKELSDLIEWDYAQPAPLEADMPALEDEDMPEWVQAGEFQLPLDLRRKAMLKDMQMSDEARKQRDKMKAKKAKRKEERKQAKKLEADEKEEIKKALMTDSRHEQMIAQVPSASTKKKKNTVKKKKLAKKMMKNQLKDKIRKMAATKAKEKIEDKQQQPKALASHPAKAEPLPDEPPLPPPSSPPAPLEEHELDIPSSKLRVVSEHAGSSLFGRQGTAMGASEKALHVLLEADGLHKKNRTAWVDRSYLEPVEGDKKQWKWPQLTLQRWHKQEILLDAGIIFEDPALLDSWGELEAIKLLC